MTAASFPVLPRFNPGAGLLTDKKKGGPSPGDVEAIKVTGAGRRELQGAGVKPDPKMSERETDTQSSDLLRDRQTDNSLICCPDCKPLGSWLPLTLGMGRVPSGISRALALHPEI